MLGVALPTLSFTMKADIASESGVVGRRHASPVRVDDSVVIGFGDPTLRARRIGILFGRVVDGDEQVKTTLARKPGDPVLPFRCPIVARSKLRTDLVAANGHCHRDHGTALAVRSEHVLSLPNFDANDLQTFRRRGQFLPQGDIGRLGLGDRF